MGDPQARLAGSICRTAVVEGSENEGVGDQRERREPRSEDRAADDRERNDEESSQYELCAEACCKLSDPQPSV